MTWPSSCTWPFQQFQHTRAVPGKQARLGEIDEEKKTIIVEGEESVKEYAELRRGIAECEAKMLTHITDPARSLTFLKAGWLLRTNIRPTSNTLFPPLGVCMHIDLEGKSCCKFSSSACTRPTLNLPLLLLLLLRACA